jgi:hypothetical protein
MPSNEIPQHPTTTSARARTLLWVAVVISAICNATTSVLGVNVIVSIAFGLLTLGFGVALVANYRRNR